MSDIQGMDQLLAKLKKLKELKDNPDALLAGAFVLEKYSKENAPVLTGFLRASGSSRKAGKKAEVIFSADYALPVEMGTAKRPPNGFVRRALDEHSDDIVKAVGEEISKDIGRLT
jgi:HK97 gp10 family phage protein